MVKMNCDMCGVESQLFKALIEGGELNVCKACAKYGKILHKIRQEPKRPKKQVKLSIEQVEKPDKQIVLVVVNDYSKRVKKKREHMGLKQEDLAKRINERESIIHKIESGRFKPSMKLARKLEKFLRITLIEQYEETFDGGKAKVGENLTIGDLIKVKSTK